MTRPQKWSFPDANKIYSKKLIIERSLLAIARYETLQELQKSDKDALQALRQMLADALKVDTNAEFASLSADASTNMNLVVNLLLAANLVNSLPAVKQYLNELTQTISKVAESKTINRKQKDQLIKFAQAFSTNLGSEIASKSRGLNTFATAT